MDATPQYPASWHFPEVREARLCAERMLERQVSFMRSRGFPVERPTLRVTRDPYLLFRIQNQEVMGATFHLQDAGWHVMIPAGAERELCRNETRTRVGLMPDGLLSTETLFHELAHQFYPDEVRAEYRALRLTSKFYAHVQSVRVRLGPALSWRAS
jgi:hypothetical protein